jgi:phosphopantothenoylcysteine decarboxylase/phosphopantothenate--cysteine ligase
MMKCIVTAGPTFEPLDDVRRLTNFSTGRLGSCLADYLQERMPQVRTYLLRGLASTFQAAGALDVQSFSTPSDLCSRNCALGDRQPCAIFHAAAVNDFGFR